MSRLRRCPFCGGTATVHDWKEDGLMPYSAWAVECDDCGADGGWWPSRASAIENWNRRDGMDDNERVTEAETIRNAEKDNLSITGELRGWASQWRRVHLSDDGIMSIGSIETDDPTPTVENIILGMANRIDFMHAHEMTMARGEAIQRLGSNIADKYIKLPVDADGVPIHVGDVMEFSRFDVSYNPAVKVDGIGAGVFFSFDEKLGRFAQKDANAYRHVQPHSWERIIQDAMKGTERDGTPKTYDGFEELVERCRRLAHEDE